MTSFIQILGLAKIQSRNNLTSMTDEKDFVNIDTSGLYYKKGTIVIHDHNP
jgi:hypothetical protein